MNTGSLLRLSLRRLGCLTGLLAAVSVPAAAQNVPVPFTSTAAGGGVVCANSISTYAPLAANQKLVGDGCPAAQSTFNTAVAAAIDRFNNVVIADQTDDLVRVIYNGGAAMAAAITAANAQTTTPIVPQVGYIYTLVGGPQSTPSQTTYYCTELGSGVIGYNKQLDGCPGAYNYVQPRGMAFDKDGNLFISSLASSYTVEVLYVGGTTIANLIALENPTMVGAPQVGYVYEIAGTGASSNTTGGDGGLAYKATIGQPRGLWIDSNDDVYIADATNGLVRRVDSTTGFISTVAGSCTGTSCPAVSATGDGNPATSSAVKMNVVYGLVFDSNGNMFIADSGSGNGSQGRIRVVYAGGTLAGIGNPVVGDIYTYAGGGATNGTQAQQAVFQYVEGVGIDANGFLYVDDYRNATSPGSNHIWRIDPATGNATVIAGNGGTSAVAAGAFCSNSSGSMATDSRSDGCPGPQAYLNAPQQGPAFDSLGNFYMPEHNGNVLRYFYYNNTFPSTPVGSSATQTLAFAMPFATGVAPATFFTDGGTGTDFSDAGGGVCVGAASTPQGSVCTTNVKFTPSAGGVREGYVVVSPSATVTATSALVGVGSAAQLTIDPGTAVSLGTAIKPQGVSVDLLGNVYLSDGTGKQVLKTTLAGGTPTAVLTGLGSPRGTTTDSYGNVYVADATNNVVLQLAKSGTVTTVISGLNGPSGMAADVRGNVYVADTGNNRILRYSPVSGVASPVNVYPQTLASPTALQMDASGDLYILDSGNRRIVEIPPAALPQVVALPAGVVPAAFAIDHAGDLYLADTASDSILLARTSGAVATLQTGLVTPLGLAIDQMGDLFLADSATTSVLSLKRTLSTDSFATTNINAQSLPTALTLSSIGDVAATLGSTLFTSTGNTADFPATTSGNTCSASLVIAAGATCSESFVFAPVATGPRAATVTFTPAAGAAVSANFSGTAVNLISTTLAIAQTAPTTTTVSYGQSTTFVATLTASKSSSTAPTGTVTFVIDGVKQTAQTVAASGNFLTDNLAVGTHVIAASYSGDANYASSNSSFSLTVLKAATATTVSSAQSVAGVTLTAVVVPAYTGAIAMTGTVTFYIDGVAQTPQPVGNGTVSQLVSVADGTHAIYAVYSGDANYAASTSTTASVVVKRTPTTTALTIATTANTTTVSLVLSVTVTGAGGTPSGTVAFYNGTTLLSTVTLSSTGTATLPTAVVSNYLFTASYSGNGLFQPSTVTLTETPDFAVLQQPAALAVVEGSQAVATVSVVSVANYTGSITATCSNLPVNSLCRFSPVPLTVSPGVNGNLGVEVFVGTYSQVASIGWIGSRNPLLCGLALLLAAASFAGLRRRRNSRLVRGLLRVATLCLLTLGAGGCAQTNAATFQNQTYTTPAGTYPITVTLTDSNGDTHSITLNVQVTTS